MSYSDKFIENSIYYTISQLFGFTLPIILTPIIIYKIGAVEFGIYAILMGFAGTFGILDLGISTSFIKYITDYNIKKDYENLKKFISTGFLFYFIFSIAIFLLAVYLSEFFLKLFNIHAELLVTSAYAFKLCMVTFLISNITTIFTCILFSTQNIRKTSIIGIFLHIINFITVIFLLEKGYGLAGLFYAQIGFSLSILLLNYIVSRSSLPGITLSWKYFDWKTLKQMYSFGIYLQVSRIALLLSEKFDEFLLGAYTNLTNVTYFNSASKIVKASRFFPLQVIPQMGTASAVLVAHDNVPRIKELFETIIKFLLLFSLPTLSFLYIYSELIILLWLGPGFESAATLLKILVIGQLTYLVFSIPGNSILPGIGAPKYIMHEGLITLALNLTLTFLFIKLYGVSGAAIGTTIAISVSSVYLFKKTYKALNYNRLYSILKLFISPSLITGITGVIFFFIKFLFINRIIIENSRLISIFILIILFCLYSVLYAFIIHYTGYLSIHEKQIIKKIFSKFTQLFRAECSSG